MKFDASEVLNIEDLGESDGIKIKAVSLKGGLTIAVKSAGDQSQVLASASHIGILRHAIKKSMPGFRAVLMKSESNETQFTDYTNLLPEMLSKSGYGLYAIYKNDSETEISITRHLQNEVSFTALMKADSVSLSKAPEPTYVLNNAFIAVGKAAAKEAVKAGKEFVEYDNRKFPAKELAEK